MTVREQTDRDRALATARANLNSRPGYLLRRCLQNTSSLFEQSCAETGITIRQYDYLFVLGKLGTMTQTELSNVLEIDRSTNTLVIRNLEKKGLVSRRAPENDARKKCVRLTKAGQDALEHVRPRAKQAAENLLSALSDTERTQLMHALAKVARSRSITASRETGRSETG